MALEAGPLARSTASSQRDTRFQLRYTHITALPAARSHDTPLPKFSGTSQPNYATTLLPAPGDPITRHPSTKKFWRYDLPNLTLPRSRAVCCMETTLTPPTDYKSATELCSNHPNLAEYIAQTEGELMTARLEIDDILSAIPADAPCQHAETGETVAGYIIRLSKQIADSAKVLGMATDAHLILQNKADMWRDEFQRIKALCYGKSLEFLEIEWLCDRAMLDIRSNVSLIDQREKVAEENAALRRFWTHSSVKPTGEERKVLCWVAWPESGWPSPPEPIVGWWKSGPGCFSVESVEHANHLVTHWAEMPEPRDYEP